MKARFIIGLFLAATLAATGCRSIYTGSPHAVQVKVIDEKTGLPMAGVSATWREDTDDLFFGHFQNGPVGLPPSDNEGLITIKDAHQKMDGRLILTCLGYTTVYGTYSDGGLETSDNIQPPPLPQNLFILDDVQAAAMDGNCFIVRMHK